MTSDIAKRDPNSVTTLMAVSLADGVSPVTLWADPVTHALLVTGGGGTVKYLVASSTAPAATQAMADYICDGVADDVQLNAAIIAAQGSSAAGGKVEMSEGKFYIAATVSITASFIEYVGRGMATEMIFANGVNTTMLSVTGTGVIHVHVKNFLMDGNKANNSTGTGLNLSTPWTNAANDTYHVFEDLCIKNFNNNAVNVPQNSDTRVTKWNRITVQKCDGNGFYMPVFCLSDSTFDVITVSEIALNGFYVGCNTCYFNQCYTFYCGSDNGGNYHGFYIVAYNNNFNECVAQDNYNSGFYGDNSQGYNANGCTFTGCIADSNGQKGGTTYATGFHGVDVTNWTIIGGSSFTRIFPPTWTQKWGVKFTGASNTNYTSGVNMYSNSVADYSDTSTGYNYFAPGPSYAFEAIGAINVMSMGATGDCKRLFGVVASSGSSVVTCASASFTQADVGKKVLCYKEQFYGVITTIASVQSSTQVTLSVNSAVTSTSAEGYMIYGTDDSVAIAKAFAYAQLMVQIGSGSDANQPISSGHVKVLFPGNHVQSMYMITSQLTVPNGVIINANGAIANMLANRNTPCMTMQAFSGIESLELQNLGGTGIIGGSGNSQQQIQIGALRIWHGIGAQTNGVINVPQSVAATPSTTGGTLPDATYYYVVTAIDSTGGESGISAEATATVTGGTNHGSVALTWTAFTGAASYRIYRGTAAGLESVYYTSGTNSYTDTNTTSTTDYPTTPGFALKLIGNQFKIGSLYVKECSIGVYHHSGTDFICDSAFLVGCGTPIRERASNQTTYSHVFLDTCGPSSVFSSMGGIAIDSGCSNLSMKVQMFNLTGVTRTLSPIVNIGSLGGTVSKDMKISIQANNAGGVGISIANAQDLDVDMILSNAVFSSGSTNPFTTAVVYGTGNLSEIRVRGIYSSGITPSSGSQVGNHEYQIGGIPTFSVAPLFMAGANMNNQKITNLLDPTSAQDAASKNYVDTVAQGLSPKPSARLASTAALPTNVYANGSSGAGATLTGVSTGVLTIDGSAVALNDYVLIKDEATGANNGLYKCTLAGAVGVAYILTRAVEMNTSTEFAGAYVFIEAGTANSGAGFVCTNSTPPTVGSTAITFTQFSGAGEIIAGNGLLKAANTLSIDTTITATVVKPGIAKISGGAIEWGIPGSLFVSNGTTALNINEVRYIPFLVPYAVTITAQQFEVTSGPAGAANVRIGIYAADTNQQPTGAPVYDSTSIAVAMSFTGVKTTSSLSVALTAGLYLVAINTDTIMSLRTITTAGYSVQAAMGATPIIQRMSVAQTYGAFPNPGTAWTAINGSAGGLQHSVMFQYT